MVEVYQEGMKAFEKNELIFSSKKFSEAELNFKDIDLAAKASIMSAYSLYGMNYYDEAIEILKISKNLSIRSKCNLCPLSNSNNLF